MPRDEVDAGLQFDDPELVSDQLVVHRERSVERLATPERIPA